MVSCNEEETVAVSTVSVQLPTQQFVDGAHAWMRRAWADVHRFKVLVWHRRARKTTLGLNRLITAAAETQNESYLYVSPTYKQAKAIVMHDPLMLSRWLPREALRHEFNKSELFGEFHSGSKLFIKGADDPDSIRGPRYKGVVFDEFAKMKPAVWHEILYPTLLETNGWAMFGFTPKGRNHAWDLFRRAESADHPDYSRMLLRASDSHLLSDVALAQAQADMGDDLYQQEFECEFLESASSVFKGLEACIAGEFQPAHPDKRYVMGVDLGRTHDATVLTVLDCAARHLVAYHRMTDSDWALQKRAIAELSLRYHDPLLLVDQTGIGSPIVEDLRELGLSVEGYTYTEQSKRTLIDGLRIAIAQRLITIPREATQLLEELQDFEMTLGERGQVFFSAPEGEGFYDDSVNSLALAVHALKSDLYAPRIETTRYDYENAIEEIPANQGIGFG